MRPHRHSGVMMARMELTKPRVASRHRSFLFQAFGAHQLIDDCTVVVITDQHSAPCSRRQLRCFARRARLLLIASVAITGASCGSGTVTETGSGPRPVDTTATVPTVARGSIAVSVDFDANDRDLAARAGVSLRSMQVTLQSLSRVSVNLVVPVASDGRLRFDDLLEGRYSLSIQRLLTLEEIDRLSASERWSTAFTGGQEVVVRPPSVTNAAISLVAPRRGSLVISEIFPYRPGPPIFYSFGNYLEVYNNSDSTVYLDAMVLFRTNIQLHTDIWGSCSRNASLRTDSTGVWAKLLYAFPGSGRDFPIAPGNAKVIAMDAMNHAIASPMTAQVDLSRADFEEFGTDADIDNPFVPNLIRVRAGTQGLGRGWPLEGEISYGVALPLGASPLDSTGSLTRASDGLSTMLYRIPASHILDVASFAYTPEVLSRLAQTGSVLNNCVPWLSSAFDQSAAYLVDFVDPRSITRRSLGRTNDGREILQRTQSSARDFEHAIPLRRSLQR